MLSELFIGYWFIKFIKWIIKNIKLIDQHLFMVEDSKHYQDLNSINSYNSRFVFSFRKLMKFMGPGFLICIAYIDPGNRNSYKHHII